MVSLILSLLLSKAHAAPIPKTIQNTVYIETARGSGSGVLIAPGLVLSAEHVCSVGLTRVVDQRGESHLVKSIRTSERLDLCLIALIKPISGYQKLVLAPNDESFVGEVVLFAGFPRGEWRLSAGFCRMESLEPVPGVPHLLIDTVAIPGNSGGPLFDRKGRLIGVVVRTYMSDDPVQGYAVAVLHHLIRAFLSQK